MPSATKSEGDKKGNKATKYYNPLPFGHEMLSYLKRLSYDND